MIPMRLKKREVTDPIVLKQILQECHVVRLGLKDEEGMVIVPVNFGYEMTEGEREKPRLRLYFHSATAGRKVHALAFDSHVAVEMDCGYELITGDYSCSFSKCHHSLFWMIHPICNSTRSSKICTNCTFLLSFPFVSTNPTE